VEQEKRMVLERFQEQLTPGAKGKAPIPPVTKDLAGKL
jgi:hypothetical protein